jgi:hypothetical protein
MRTLKALFIVCVVVIAVACGGSERKANRATARSADSQAKIAQERLKLVEDYKKCVKKAGEDKNKIEACDSYLKAAESLK